MKHFLITVGVILGLIWLSDSVSAGPATTAGSLAATSSVSDGGVFGLGAANQVAFWTTPHDIAGDPGMTYVPATDILSVIGGVGVGTGAAPDAFALVDVRSSQNNPTQVAVRNATSGTAAKARIYFQTPDGDSWIGQYSGLETSCGVYGTDRAVWSTDGAVSGSLLHSAGPLTLSVGQLCTLAPQYTFDDSAFLTERRIDVSDGVGQQATIRETGITRSSSNPFTMSMPGGEFIVTARPVDTVTATAFASAVTNTLSVTTGFHECTCNSGSVCPFDVDETGITSGTRVVILGVSTDPCRATDTPGNMQLNGGANQILNVGDTLEIIYSATRSEWLEVSSSNN